MFNGRFTGAITALITPFRDGEIDEAALVRFVEFQLEQGIHGLVPCGTTGESPSLTTEEHERVVALTVQTVRAWSDGTNSTAEAIHFSRTAARDGADALLHVTPYYNKPTQEGLYRHFSAVAAATPLPIILYNVPGRTGVNLLPETVARLAQDCPTIVGIKEASGNLDQASDIRRLCGPDFILLSGDDSLTLPMLAIGGNGIISVMSNVAPAETAELVEAWWDGEHAEAQALHLRLFPLMRALFVETNPGPAKAAAELLGLCSGELRLPLAPVAETTRARLIAALEQAGVRIDALVGAAA